jgi:hypothetical protein
MIVTVSPNPFQPEVGFDITVSGGVPPFTYRPRSSPPNPPGVTVNGNNVSVPAGTPGGTQVVVDVTDSSDPPQRSPCASKVI